MCDASCLESGKNLVPHITVVNCLKNIGSKPITYNNALPPINQALILQSQVKYVEDIFVTRDTSTIGMSRRGVIQTISDIGKACSYVQAEIHLDCIIREKRLPNLKRHGRVIKSQAKSK